MRALLRDHGLADRVVVDSAGTSREELGNPTDPRSVAAARRRGIALDHVARQITAADFARFDLLVAMDAANARALARLARSPADAAKVRLLRSFDPASPDGAEVPDPWYGGDDGFEHVLDVCDAGCRGLLDHVRAALRAPRAP